MIITALKEVVGDYGEAIKEASKILNVRGTVLPVTLDDVRLCAELETGEVIVGETNIDVPKHDPNIKINGYWPLPAEQTLINASEGRPAYLILKESQELPSGYKNTQLINQYRRGKGDTFLKFYRINHSIN